MKWLRLLFLYSFFMGAIDHAPRIILQASTGTGAIVPVSWQALLMALISV
jgi:hypothetical protein